MMKSVFSTVFKSVMSALILLALGFVSHWVFESVVGQPELAKAMLGVCVILAGGFAVHYLVGPIMRALIRKLGTLALKRSPAKG